MQASVFTKEQFLRFIETQIKDGETVALSNIFKAFETQKKAGHTATGCFPDFIFEGEPDVRNVSRKTPVIIIINPDLSEETQNDIKEAGQIHYKF